MLKRPQLLKIFAVGGIALIFIAVVALGIVANYGVGLFKKSLPVYAGQEKLSGLSGDVRVFRDSYGVPHIFASNMNDAVRTLGYVHASERLFQMEMQRRAGQGRLSEVLGSDMLDVDKFLRTLGIYHLAESSAASMSPQAQSFFQAYADGVNTFLETHHDRMPPEFTLLHIKPEPWRVADSVVWGKLMALQLSHNYKLEMLRAKLATHLSPVQMEAVFPLAPGSAPVTLAPRSTQKTMMDSLPPAGRVREGGDNLGVAFQNRKQFAKRHSPSPRDAMHRASREGRGMAGTVTSQSVDAYDKLGKFTGLDHGASNEWVIAGKRTETGKPILANDPHLGLEAPILWYLARIITPDFSIKGATVPGLPIVLLGQNDHIAWGFTTTGSDVQDLFLETIDPQHPDHYLAPKDLGGSLAFDIREEVIRVKGGLDVKLKVRSTRHGPVMSDIDDDMEKIAGDSKVLTLAFAGLGEHDRTSESLMLLNRAQNWKEFLQALTLYQSPPQNCVYADTVGNIGFINPGLVPVRKAGDGLMPADGASGAFDWVGMIPFKELPQLYNPAAGFVFNANNAIAFNGGQYFLGVDWEEPYRASRLQQFFDSTPKFSLDKVAAMQADHLSLVAKQLLPSVLKVKLEDKHALQAQDMLRSWDGVMDKNKPEPLIFDAWLYHMRQKMLADKTGDNLNERGPYMASSIAAILGRNLTDWCGEKLGKPSADCHKVIAEALQDAVTYLRHHEKGEMKDWRWGDEHQTLLAHKVWSHIPFLQSRADLSVASSGDFYTLDRGGSFTHDPKHFFARTHGGGYRAIYDLGKPELSRFMITTGQSGNIFSPHYGDLVPLWNDVQAITLAGSEKELQEQKLPELVFTP